VTDTTTELNGHHDVLTPLQSRFVEACLDTGSAVEAYRRAGGRATTNESAWSGACRLLRNDKVSRALAEHKAQRRQLTIADSAWIREKLVQVVNRAMQEVPVTDSAGEPTGVWRCDLTAANAALRTLVALNAADPPPKDDQASYEAAKARLERMGIEMPRLPTPEEFALAARLGVNNTEARKLCGAEAIKAKLRARGVDATAPATNPGGPA
jgi:hypothetical protein